MNLALVTRTCYQCKKESNGFLVFFKPRGWIKHRTPDQIDMLFCSLACFKAFTHITKLTGRPEQVKKPIEEQEEQLLATAAN